MTNTDPAHREREDHQPLTRAELKRRQGKLTYNSESQPVNEKPYVYQFAEGKHTADSPSFDTLEPTMKTPEEVAAARFNKLNSSSQRASTGQWPKNDRNQQRQKFLTDPATGTLPRINAHTQTNEHSMFQRAKKLEKQQLASQFSQASQSEQESNSPKSMAKSQIISYMALIMGAVGFLCGVISFVKSLYP